jgi:hypothetical protein
MRAANDNIRITRWRAPSGYKERADDIRYELEQDLIEAMDVDQRVKYRKHGIVPLELESIAARIEVEVAAAIDALRDAA